MRYLIFSDESGSWHDGDFYIRSWVRVEPSNYDDIRKETIFAKHETGVKELNWARFQNNEELFKSIFEPEFSVFITITKLSHFKSKSYSIISAIESVPVSTGGESLTLKIKQKISDSAKNELFFHYYEKMHIEMSKKALLEGIESSEFKYIIDTPQYLDKSWESIAQDCGIQQTEIIKISATNPGIELADVVAGCINGLINGEAKAKKIYSDHIQPKMIDMQSRAYPNPNLIFFGDFSSSEVAELNIFR